MIKGDDPSSTRARPSVKRADGKPPKSSSRLHGRDVGGSPRPAPSAAEVTSLFANAVQVTDFTGPGFTNGGAKPADIDVVLDSRVNNTALTRTRGFDIGLRYAFQAGSNALVVEGNVTHVVQFEDRLIAGGPVIIAVDRPYRPLAWRGRGGLSWSRSGWSASAFVNHADDYLDDRTATRRDVRGHTTIDLNLAYSVGAEGRGLLRGTRIALYVENLFDNEPPRLLPDAPSATGVGYDPINASARGRYVALQLRKSW